MPDAANEPRCSIVIPVFNGAEHVARAVRSALDQTFTDREVIVVNDGSTDGSAAALTSLMQDIVYIEQPHSGVAAARNRALQAARGQVIAFLDADDEWPPAWLEVAVRYLEEHPNVDVATGRKRHQRPLRGFRRRRQAFWIVQYNFAAYASVVPRRFFDAYGPFDEALRACVDWEMWIRLVTNGVRLGEAPTPSGWYARLPTSITAVHDTNLRNELLMFERLEGRLGSAVLGARLEMARGKAALVDDDYASARHHFLKAMRMRSPLALSMRLLALGAALAPRRTRRIHRSVAQRRRRSAARLT